MLYFVRMIIGIVITAILSALFSAAETAFSDYNRSFIKNLASDGKKRANLAQKLSSKNEELQTTVLVLNSLANVTLTVLTILLMKELIQHGGILVGWLVSVLLIAIFCEITPKFIATCAPNGTVMLTAPVLFAGMVILTPLNLLFGLWKRLISKIFKVSEDKGVTEEELITIIDEAQLEGGIDEQEGELIRSAIEFVDVEAEAIMTPRVDVTSVDKDEEFSVIADIFYQTGYSRLPVFEQTIDSIIGVLHEKDFFRYVMSGEKSMSEVLKKPFFVTSHVKISKLMKSFQESKAHMAVVLDDYGGTMGIVTLEDVIEELVGDIWDEHDEVVEQVTEHSDGSFTIAGDTRTEDLFEQFGIEIDEEEGLPQTVGGFVTMCLEQFPEVSMSVDYKCMHIEVTAVDDRRVSELRITRITPVNDDEGDEE